MENIITYGVPVILVLLGNVLGGYTVIGSFFGALIGIVPSILFMIYRLRADLLMVLGSRALMKKETQKCFDYYQKAYKTGRLKPEYQLYYAYTAMRYGRMERAKSLFDKILSGKKMPPDVRLDAKSSYSLYLWRMGELDAAVQTMEEAFLEGENTANYVRLGFLLLEQKNYSRAKEINLKAYEYNPDDASIMDNLALSYFYEGEYEKAAELYEKIAKNDPKMPVIYYNNAMVSEKMGNIDLAKELLSRALTCKFSHLAAVSHEEVEQKLNSLENQ